MGQCMCVCACLCEGMKPESTDTKAGLHISARAGWLHLAQRTTSQTSRPLVFLFLLISTAQSCLRRGWRLSWCGGKWSTLDLFLLLRLVGEPPLLSPQPRFILKSQSSVYFSTFESYSSSFPFENLLCYLDRWSDGQIERDCCERSTGDELSTAAVFADLKGRFASISPQKSRGADNQHMILPSVGRRICPKDRRVLNTSLDSATVIQLCSFMALTRTHTSTLYPHSNAPADGRTHSTEAKGNYTTELSPWTQELQPVWWGQGYENMHRFSSWSPKAPTSTAFPHCGFGGGVGAHVQVGWATAGWSSI